MYKNNRNAMTNLRHIIYDITGNMIAFLLTHIISIFLYEKANVSFENTLLASCLFITIYVLTAKNRKMYDATTFCYADRILRTVLFGCIVAAAIVSTVFYFTGRARPNRDFYITYFLLSVLGLLITAYVSYYTTRNRNKSTRTLLVGSREDYDQFLHYISQTNLPFTLVGYARMEAEPKEVGAGLYLGGVEGGELERILQQQAIDQVYIMRNTTNAEKADAVLKTCMELGLVTCLIHADLFENRTAYISAVGTYPVITYHINDLNPTYQAAKRLMDIMGAIVGILLSAPSLPSRQLRSGWIRPAPHFSPKPVWGATEDIFALSSCAR